MTRRYRFLVDGRTEPISVNGRWVAARRGASLLATLLTSDEFSGEIRFYCGIGQCLRCNCRVDGELQRSCMYFPTGGEQVDLIRTQPLEPGQDEELNPAWAAAKRKR